MATLAPTFQRINAERRFFLFSAAFLTVGVLIGFARTWYLAPFTGVSPLPASVHLHGALATAWLLLFGGQVGLIAGGRRDLHQIVGRSGALVGAAAIVTSLFVSIAGYRSGRTVAAALSPSLLLFVQLVTIMIFIAFVAYGLTARRDPAAHKRWMLLASMTIAVPGLARIARMVHTWPLPANAFGGMILTDILLVALVVHDLKTRGRLHSVTLWGGGIYLFAQPFRYFVGSSDWWTGVATIFA